MSCVLCSPAENIIKEAVKELEDTPKVINTAELEEPTNYEVENGTILIRVLFEDTTKEAVKGLEETPKVINTTELEEPTKQEVEDETILIPVLSEDITKEAVKVLEEIPKVIITTKPEETDPAKHGLEDQATLISRTFDGLTVMPEDINEEDVMPLPLPLVLESNQDNAQKSLSKETIKLLEETSKVAKAVEI